MSEPGTVSVVPMTAGHVSALMRYEDELFGSEAWSAEAYRDEIADTRSRHYLAAVDGAGELLAWAGIRVVGDSAEVLTVGVIPAARRRGIARRMLRTLLGRQRPEAPMKPSSKYGWTTWPRAGSTKRKGSPRWAGGAATTTPVAWTRWSCARSCRDDRDTP